MYHTILFDLDGTLTASGEGITKSVQYALARMGRPEPDLKKLELFIGPPLTEQFMQYAGYDYATAKQATGYFQERYETVGLFENKPFPGVGRLLQGLRDSGRTLCVASSKPERFVRIILQHFGLDSYFAEMVGAHMDETGSHKDEVIGEALRRLGLTDHRAGTIMVGDKSHDIVGARQQGLPAIGVTYGYGTPAELEAARPLRIVNSLAELRDFFAADKA
ncbi:MAG: HAD hydrolase-like protein [Acidaminococcaceae bacterium]|jgi:phosphoglycolate phosphatase|nr:HAD hydrolase-like protein [Acidaminococcaceae bacterium]